MNYVWASVITLGVLLLAVVVIIAIRRWVSTKKHKIKLGEIIGLVTGGVALASATFFSALQVLPSAPAPPTPANAQSTPLCPSKNSGALIQLWPRAAKSGSHVTIAGDGFPANDVVAITFYDARSPSNEKFDDIGSIRSDACGKFNYPWSIPGSLVTSSYSTVKILATDQNTKPGEGKNCCQATAILVVNAAS